MSRPELETAGAIERCLASELSQCRGWVQLPYAELRVPQHMRHFWSPRLELTFDHAPEGTTHIHGVFRPEPGVWTGFVFMHSVLGVVACIGLTMGLSQWTLGDPPIAILAFPLAAALSLALYIGALVGHRLGSDEMTMLRQELDCALYSCGLTAPDQPASPDEASPQ
ncbi:hypothetical protein G6O69_34530 [Pseudenhygromyxa sp. WMMC2535]|uniref:hypothetical protein n=1 Tax=Pseudenhygromyxa sp. WMMC2535 TaxID=2712867 RepID=UPI001557B10F|nr:hypothetical protein [Pseudenhygromyxa sp. WMMC2535]NVB42990.1 hypothetical protein [Pseudenhygromyxa sp. WMMC2535]